MTTTVISNNMPYSFGQQTNQAVTRLIALNTQIARLGEAIKTASAGYSGVPGTQFEGSASGPITPINLFGVQADPEKPGEQGQAYAYAMGRLSEEWTKFWTLAVPFVEQLDNGGTMT